MELLTRENQHFFLNSKEVRGVKSVNIDSDFGAGIVSYLGMTGAPEFISVSKQASNLSASAYLASVDPFISFTGVNGFNAFILEDVQDPTINIGVQSGYLTNYQFNLALGQIPEISMEAIVLGGVSRMTQEALGDHFTGIQGDIKEPIQIASYGSVDIGVNDIELSNIRQLSVQVIVNRNAIYALGLKQPIRVLTVWPVEVTCSFSISAKNFNLFNSLSFPETSRKSDINITIKDFQTEDTINSFSFPNMTLIGQNPSQNSDGDSEVRLTYKAFVNEK